MPMPIQQQPIDLSTWTDIELHQTYLALMALGSNGRLTAEDRQFLAMVIAERTRRFQQRESFTEEPHLPRLTGGGAPNVFSKHRVRSRMLPRKPSRG